MQRPTGSDAMAMSQGALSAMDAPDAAETAEPVTKVPLTVEVRMRPESTARFEDVETAVLKLLSSEALPYADGPLALPSDPSGWLEAHVEALFVVDTGTAADAGSSVPFWQASLRVLVHQLSEESAAEEEDEAGDGGGGASYRDWALPSRAFAGLWEALVYESDVKAQLLRYARTALLFADAGVDPALVSVNRVVLLHGPPGTGKTSLAKALAQKLSIRFARRYAAAQLVEINAHSLFSKWFSESGKLVGRLFAKIGELVEDPDTLVCVLIDEVESLSAARRASSSEPSDAIRVVNALLTQLDALKDRPNVLILTTSNITDAIDVAFIDRADIKAYIGPPGLSARYDILRSCVRELAAKGVISTQEAAMGDDAADAALPPPWTALPAAAVAAARAAAPHVPPALRGAPPGLALLAAAAAADGLSGRALRKLPFLAHAAAGDSEEVATVAEFLEALHTAVTHERADRAAMGSN